MIRSILPAVLIVCVSASSSAVGESSPVSGAVLERAREACVEVLVDGVIKGGGTFISEDGYGISAAHLWARSELPAEIVSEKRGRHPIRVVGFDLGHDLVLWRCETNSVPWLPLRASPTGLGEPLAVLGPALRNPILAMHGRVALAEPVFAEFPTFGGYSRCLLVNGIAPGLASGGCWIDREGFLVGVQSGFLNDDNRHSGLSMVAPTDAVRDLFARKDHVENAKIGGFVWELWTAHEDHVAGFPAGTEGLIVTRLMDGGALQRAGVKLHDVILELDGVPVRRRAEFMAVIRAHAPGETIACNCRSINSVEPRTVSLEPDSLEDGFFERPEADPVEDGE